MPHYIRARIAGGTYFSTVTLLERQRHLLTEHIDALRADGHQVEEGRQLWGERRAKVITPAGHLVEIMADPPPPVVE